MRPQQGPHRTNRGCVTGFEETHSIHHPHLSGTDGGVQSNGAVSHPRWKLSPSAAPHWTRWLFPVVISESVSSTHHAAAASPVFGCVCAC
eukprot:m.93086 g.93086  ORF g.93086 m.93086 type:complete len:90 (+) comp12106_c0_seq1:178-447(+)